MSITVLIKNKDSRSAAVVVVRKRIKEGPRAGAFEGSAVALKGGDEVEMLIHSDIKIEVDEIYNG